MMARKKTYERNSLDDMFDEYEAEEIVGEKLEITPPDSNATDIKSPLNFEVKKKEPSVTKSFRISEELNQYINDMVTDKNGKKYPGAKGFQKVFITNAIIKEMVAIGTLDESYLEKLIPYDDI